MKHEPKLPIGIQSFEVLRKDGCVYVDKTELIYNLINQGSYYFLARPRRFGKSLLLSTIVALFEGKKELFDGLWIASSDYQWKQHPVIHLDLSMPSEKTLDSLKEQIEQKIILTAKNYGIEIDKNLRLDGKLVDFFHQVSAKCGRVVILIDEYDNPIHSFLENPDELKQVLSFLNGFYSKLKTLSEHIRFCFLTGVAQFSKTSIFSGLNHLNDISFRDKYSTILGYTQTELESFYSSYLDNISLQKNIQKTLLLEEMRKWYNGYQFTPHSVAKVYNPFSILLFLSNEGEFKDYWFSSGNPSFLYQFLNTHDIAIEELDGITLSTAGLERMSPENLLTEPLLFQTGYLTITHYCSEEKLVTLGFPNLEVRQSFINHYLVWLSGKDISVFHQSFTRARSALMARNIDDFIKELKNYFINIPNLLHSKTSEKQYHALLYVFVASLGFGIKTAAEVYTSRVRIDLCIETKDDIYICELKVDKDPDEALNQIHSRKYYEQFYAKKKQITLLGISFDTKENNISSWKKETLLT